MGVSIPLSDQAPMRYNFVPLVEPLCQLKAAPLVLVPIRAAVVSLEYLFAHKETTSLLHVNVKIILPNRRYWEG